VEFREVSFAYQSGATGARRRELRIRGGEKVAVVGASGAGKSTLVKLLFRFYDPDAGAVLIDGRISARSPSSPLRRQIAIVPQDCVLFNDTLAENIRYGNPEADDEAVDGGVPPRTWRISSRGCRRASRPPWASAA
jgi:ABC-type multidrug transport system fused ATPase/permease subunit